MTVAAIQITTERLDDGSFFVESIWAPGCWGHGATKDEAVHDFVTAYQSWKELRWQLSGNGDQP